MGSRNLATDNYVWSLNDLMRKEMTGSVYRGRHKKELSFHFVKVLNADNQSNAEREFEILRQLDHENVIKLLALEKTSQAQPQYTFIMEYCNGGTLSAMLDQPENAYGLMEADFCCLLDGLACGMKHLRDFGIVHRNINPKNIVRHQTMEGRYVFKLIDFGTARQLEGDAVFRSFYGEFEYQFPGMYESTALGDEASLKQFNASVDLWSVGVTLYQAATGQLPFRPPARARKNPQAMYLMILRKTRGVISGLQESLGGPVFYSETLPHTCSLSPGLQNLLIPLLASLLEADQDKIMTFEKFFTEAANITKKLVIFVFVFSTCDLLHIYCNPDMCLAELLRLIGEQTGAVPKREFLFYKNCPLMWKEAESHPTTSFPATSAHDPFFLFPDDADLLYCREIAFPQFCNSVKHNLPEFPEMGDEVDVLLDQRSAKLVCDEVRYLHRIAVSAHLKQELMQKATKLFYSALVQDIGELWKCLRQSGSLAMAELTQRIRMIAASHILLHLVLCPEEKQPSARADEKFECFRQQAIQVVDQVEKVQIEATCLEKRLAEDDFQPMNWFHESGCPDGGVLSCERLVGIRAEVVGEIESHFKDKLQWKHFDESNKLLHKLEKENLRRSFSDCLKRVREICLPNLQNIFKQATERHSEFRSLSQKTEALKNEASKIAIKLNILTENVDKLQEEVYSDWLNLCLLSGTALIAESDLTRSSQEVSNHKIVDGAFVFEVSRFVYQQLEKLGAIAAVLPESSVTMTALQQNTLDSWTTKSDVVSEPLTLYEELEHLGAEATTADSSSV